MKSELLYVGMYMNSLAGGIITKYAGFVKQSVLVVYCRPAPFKNKCGGDHTKPSSGRRISTCVDSTH